MASEDLLKKAVAAFNALSPEQQAEMLEEQRQSWVRGNVGLSRDERGMTSPVMPRPAPAASDTGLKTIGFVPPMFVEGKGADYNDIFRRVSIAENYTAVVTRSQAEELLAAVTIERDFWKDRFQSDTEAIRKLEADNAALTARVKELEKSRAEILQQQDKGWRDLQDRAEALEAKLAAAEKALEFYADASKWNDGYFKSEDDGTVLRAYPSSIEKDQGDKARAVLGGKPS